MIGVKLILIGVNFLLCVSGSKILDNYLSVPDKMDSSSLLEERTLLEYKSIGSALDPIKAQILAEEVTRLPFTHRRLDLHSIYQTVDFSELQLPPQCQAFVSYMNTTFKNIVEKSFNIKLTHTTMTASKYKKHDFLLCHDDQVEDRAIAFIFYLSHDWKPSDGGMLRFFRVEDGKPTHSYDKEIVPQFNTMAMFRVTDTSFHEVEEVYADKERLTINGWFHSVKKPSEEDTSAEPFLRGTLLSFQSKVYTDTPFSDFLNRDFQAITKPMQQELLDKSHFFMLDALNKTVYGSLLKELSDIEDSKWILRGPADRRKYQTLEVNQDGNDILLDVVAPQLQRFLKTLVSDSWIKTLQKITGMEYGILSEGFEPPTSLIEIQKWRSGHYLLIGDNKTMFGLPYLEVSIFFGVNDKRMDEIQIKTGSDGYDMAGDVVYIFPNSKTDIDYNWLKKQKYQHIIHDVFSANKHNPKMKTNISLKKQVIKTKHIVEQKIGKIMSYRRKNFPSQENCNMSPVSNSMILTVNSDETKKFCYLNKRSSDDTTFHYYCITVTYLLS